MAGTTSATEFRRKRSYTTPWDVTLDDADVLGSLGSTGDAYDNALAESFVDSERVDADPPDGYARGGGGPEHLPWDRPWFVEVLVLP